MIHLRLLGLIGTWNLVLMVLTGCPAAVLPAAPLAAPVAPIAPADWTPEEAQEFSQACFSAPEPLNRTDPIAEVVFNFNHGLRDFRPPAGPDGYILQIIPLNRDFKSTPLTGRLTFILFAGSALTQDGSIGSPVHIWRIDPSDLRQYWRPSALLECYLFQLDWGEVLPQPGNYEFVVHIAYEQDHKVVNICRAVSFYENQEFQGQ